MDVADHPILFKVRGEKTLHGNPQFSLSFPEPLDERMAKTNGQLRLEYARHDGVRRVRIGKSTMLMCRWSMCCGCSELQIWWNRRSCQTKWSILFAKKDMVDCPIPPACTKVPGAESLYANPHFSPWSFPIAALNDNSSPDTAFQHLCFAHLLLLPSYVFFVSCAKTVLRNSWKSGRVWWMTVVLQSSQTVAFDPCKYAGRSKSFCLLMSRTSSGHGKGKKWPALHSCLDSLPVHLFSTSHTEWPEDMNYMGTSTWYIVHIMSLNRLPCMSFHRLSVLTTPLD